MSKSIHISIADRVFDEIEQIIKSKGIINKSQFVEELIRDGLNIYNKKESKQQ